MSVGTMRSVKKRVEEGHGEALRAGDETLASLDRQDREAKPKPKKPTRTEKLKDENARLKDELELARQENLNLRVGKDEVPESQEEQGALRSQLDHCQGELADAQTRIAKYRSKIQSLS